MSGSPQEVPGAQALARIPLFREFSAGELEQLRPTMEIRSARAGAAIMKEGQICSPDLYVLLEGSVEVREDGLLVARRGPDTVIGEIAFVLQPQRTASVIASTDSVLLRIDAVEVRTLMHRNPTIAGKLMEAIACLLGERFIELDRRVRDLMSDAPSDVRSGYEQAWAATTGLTSGET